MFFSSDVSQDFFLDKQNVSSRQATKLKTKFDADRKQMTSFIDELQNEKRTKIDEFFRFFDQQMFFSRDEKQNVFLNENVRSNFVSTSKSRFEWRNSRNSRSHRKCLRIDRRSSASIDRFVQQISRWRSKIEKFRWNLSDDPQNRPFDLLRFVFSAKFVSTFENETKHFLSANFQLQKSTELYAKVLFEILFHEQLQLRFAGVIALAEASIDNLPLQNKVSWIYRSNWDKRKLTEFIRRFRLSSASSIFCTFCSFASTESKFYDEIILDRFQAKLNSILFHIEERRYSIDEIRMTSPQFLQGTLSFIADIKQIISFRLLE